MNVRGEIVGISAEWKPQVGPANNFEIRGQDSDHCVATIVEIDFVSNNVRVGSETTLPETMAENCDRRAACAILLCRKRAANNRSDSQHGKQRRACIGGLHALWLCVVGQIEAVGYFSIEIGRAHV